MGSRFNPRLIKWHQETDAGAGQIKITGKQLNLMAFI